jgi:hypothetical protein
MLRNNGEEEQEGQHFIDSLSYTKQIRVLVQCINSPLGLFDCSLMCTTLNIKRSRSKHVWSDPTSIDAWMDTNTPTALQTAHRHHKHASSWMDIDRHNFGSRIDEGSPNYGGRTSMAMVPLHRRSMWPAGVCCTHARGCRSPFMRSNYYGCVTSVQAQS